MTLLMRIAALLASFWAAAAHGWEARTQDDGALFYGIAQGPSGMIMVCIGPSRQGVPAIQVEAHETAQTLPYALRLEFAVDWLPGNGTPPERRDVVIWADGTGYRLPLAQFNEMDGVWMADLAMNDQLVTAMRGAKTLLIGAERDQQYALSTNGISEALDAVMGFCVPEYVRMGLPVPAGLERFAAASFPAQAATPGPVARAEAAIRQGCEAEGDRTAEAIMTGDMDGDGLPDAVLDWDEVTCRTDWPRPMCGASSCSVDIFLSSRPNPPGATKNLLGAAPGLVDLSNGNKGLGIATLPATCNSTGTCWVVWYWTGSSFEALPQ